MCTESLPTRCYYASPPYINPRTESNQILKDLLTHVGHARAHLFLVPSPRRPGQESKPWGFVIVCHRLCNYSWLSLNLNTTITNSTKDSKAKTLNTHTSFDTKLVISSLLLHKNIRHLAMGESSKFPKSWTLEIQTLNLAVNKAYKIQ